MGLLDHPLISSRVDLRRYERSPSKPYSLIHPGVSFLVVRASHISPCAGMPVVVCFLELAAIDVPSLVVNGGSKSTDSLFIPCLPNTGMSKCFIALALMALAESLFDGSRWIVGFDGRVQRMVDGGEAMHEGDEGVG
ncbi:LOW QUALITY PROTEIN: hypothetical protein RJ639_012859 [Escallonia herrerae]|uniref:Uncharacterized protein n=1 Tax=Escallonia herrerae TaxID=1293975 RepID=A0AA88RUD9_9ASTE|nr:LOW QUALITY PROTEIN: hypothetical protein RJ639_025379 [Escallonia herrerae]KAK3011134.1 LOW QUALITY PROTEIN: hypothetical protein RJ639_012859 [Escallonia herrerae]